MGETDNLENPDSVQLSVDFCYLESNQAVTPPLPGLSKDPHKRRVSHTTVRHALCLLPPALRLLPCAVVGRIVAFVANFVAEAGLCRYGDDPEERKAELPLSLHVASLQPPQLGCIACIACNACIARIA